MSPQQQNPFYAIWPANLAVAQEPSLASAFTPAIHNPKLSLSLYFSTRVYSHTLDDTIQCVILNELLFRTSKMWLL